MNNVRALNSYAQAEMLTGQVQRIEGSEVWVHGEQGMVVSSVAASCLLRPVPGDIVLLSQNRRGIYILAVLERQGDEYGVQVNGNLTVTADNLKLQGRNQWVASAGDSLHQIAKTVDTTASRIASTSEHQQVHTEVLDVVGKSAKLSLDQVHGVFKRVYSKAEQVMRSVSLIEMLKLGNWITEVEDTHSQRAKNSVITAESDIKIDAERIHMG